MARSNSFNKEIEKQKLQKKKRETEEKRRKQQGTSSFEDMIAYVDANGVIIDTPPEPIQEEERIELEDIEISVPARSHRKVGGGDVSTSTMRPVVLDSSAKGTVSSSTSSTRQCRARVAGATWSPAARSQGMNAVDVKIIHS